MGAGAQLPIRTVVDNSGDLALLFRSNHPLIFVETNEERRAVDLIRHAAASVNEPLWLWSRTEGLRREGAEPQYGTESLDAALDFVRTRSQGGVFLMLDAQPGLGDPTTRRRLRETVQQAPMGQSVVITTTVADVPEDLSDIAHRWRLEPPTASELERLARRTLEDLVARGLSVDISPTDLRQMVQDLAGLTMSEAERVIQRSAFDDGRVDPGDLATIRYAKAEILNQDGILELIESTGIGLADVGGMNQLKAWLHVRHRVFMQPDQAQHLDVPRGILLTGIPGCGKSLVAKATAHSWKLPLILLDPGRLYGKYIGESEQRLASTLQIVDALSPAILWIDEIEKGFSSGGDGDGGVSRRVLGTFLRWLQERDSRVFLIATANDVRALPPELLRRGRVDDTFFVDLPDPAERHEILLHHLQRRDQLIPDADLDRLAAATEGFSGAELETVVVAALYSAFALGRPMQVDDVLAEIDVTVPLSIARAEEVAALRSWARDRARPA